MSEIKRSYRAHNDANVRIVLLSMIRQSLQQGNKWSQVEVQLVLPSASERRYRRGPIWRR